MSRVYTDTIEPRKPTQDITLGTSGETISVGANSINVNTVKDKGGNTLWTSDGSGVLSSVNAGLIGSLQLISTATATNQANVQFTSGIDSTYSVHIVKFIDIYAHTNGAEFQFNVSINGGSSYGINKTTTFYFSRREEAPNTYSLAYDQNQDLANSVDEQNFMIDMKNDADACGTGEMWFFNLSGTTYIKNFISNTVNMETEPAVIHVFTGGIIDTTSAINALFFRMNSGNVTGTLKLYGLS